MNPLRANFTELYARHLCRHSQFGINVVHLASLVGIYWAVYGLVYALSGSPRAVVAPVVVYCGVLAANVPARVLVLTTAFLAAFLGAFLSTPLLPWWAYAVAIFPLYKVQVWSHLIYTRAFDMTEFDDKYPKGLARWTLLTVYELPMQLNYLVFGPRDHASAVAACRAGASPGEVERVA
jgi:hypothetical protein